jgi:hypothetical protein
MAESLRLILNFDGDTERDFDGDTDAVLPPAATIALQAFPKP